jgi:PAS domain S-box-containing protein
MGRIQSEQHTKSAIETLAQLEKAVQQHGISEEVLRRVIDTLPVMIDVFDSHGLITVWNRECERITGYTAAEVVGNPNAIARLYPDPVKRQEMYNEWANRNAIFRNWEIELTCKDGSTRIISWSGVAAHLPKLDWVHWGIGVDVTEQHQAARDTQERFQTMSELALEYVYEMAVDEAGNRTLTWVNDAITRITGYSFEELQDLNQRLGLFLPEDHQTIAQIVERVLKGEEVRDNVRIRTKTGTIRWVQLVTRPIWDEAQQRVVRYIGSAVDVTERRNNEQERRSFENQLLETQKLASLGLLAGNIAHDFNNLLTVILGNLGMLSFDATVYNARRDQIERMKLAAQRAADLTRQLLTYTGKGRVMLQLLNLNAIIKEINLLLDTAITKGVTLHYDLSPDLPYFDADPTQMRQIVMNLVLNATEALGTNGGTIKLSTSLRDLAAADLQQLTPNEHLKPGRYVTLEVSDTGKGMDQHTLAQIFEPFFTTKVSGRGLGLAAVFGIVQAHCGGLKVTSQPEQGATFTICLPYTATPNAMTLTNDPPLAWRGSGSLLIVDDDSTICQVIAELATGYGFTTIQANTGAEASNLFRSQYRTIRAVILDLTIPQASSAELLREFRRLRRDLPIVIMSGYNLDQTAALFLGEQPPPILLQKPFHPPDLLRALHAALSPEN